MPPQDADKLLRWMDERFAAQRARLSAFQLTVIREWQKTDRTYERIQALARGQMDLGPLPAPEAARILAELDALASAIETGRAPACLTVHRGLRNRDDTFGTSDPELIADGRPRRLEGFLAASLFRAVAIEEFTAPDGALLDLRVPAGTPALWTAGVGDPRLRRQGEILLTYRSRLRITTYRREGSLLVLSGEVLPR